MEEFHLPPEYAYCTSKTMFQEDSIKTNSLRTWSQSMFPPNGPQHQCKPLPLESFNTMKINNGPLSLPLCDLGAICSREERNVASNYQGLTDQIYNEPSSRSGLPSNHGRERWTNQCAVASYYNAPVRESNQNTMPNHGLHALMEDRSNASHYMSPVLNDNIQKQGLIPHDFDKERPFPKDIQDLICALQTGGSRCKMEAAITVRSLATSHNLQHQALFIDAGGISPLVDLLKYKAGEIHWPTEMKEKATITVRAEAALALASLSVNNDNNKDAIGGAGAIPLLCNLIQYHEDNRDMAPFVILARDASAGALSCLSKSEKNKDAIIAAQIVPILVHMVDQGTSFGRAAAANVLSKLATGDNIRNRKIVGRDTRAISALLRLLEQGSTKAKETAAEALENLAQDGCNKAMILQERGIECLLKLAESGTHAEKEAATSTLKVLNRPDSAIVATASHGKSDGTDVHHCGVASNVGEHNIQLVGDCGGGGHISDNITLDDHVTQVDICKPLIVCDGTTTRATTSATTSATTENISNVLAGREESIMSIDRSQTSSAERTQEELASWKRDFMGMDSALLPSREQIVATSELTSTFAPSLVGQPSMPANAIMENTKLGSTSLFSTPSRKRLKIIHSSNCDVQGSHTMRSSLAWELQTSQKYMQNLSNPEPMHLIFTNDRRISGVQVPCEKIGNGVLGSAKDQSKQHDNMAIDNELISGGVLALVNALSSQNPGAQEFSALALMLLASEGGFEVKTTISDAGAIPLLVAMVDTSIYPMIRESAAAAIAKLVSHHPSNQAHVLKVGGLKAMVNMACWSTTLIDIVDNEENNLGGRIQAAAIIAILNIGDVLDKQSVGMGLLDALSILIHMLESDDVNEVNAGVGGLQVVSLNLCTSNDNLNATNLNKKFHDYVELQQLPTIRSGTIAIELITALLGLTQGNSKDANSAALEALTGFYKHKSKANFGEIPMITTPHELAGPQMYAKHIGNASYTNVLHKHIQQLRYSRRDGIQALSAMLAMCPISTQEIIVAVVASVVASDKLNVYMVDEPAITQHLMRLLEGGPTMATRVSAAASIANMGARNKRLDAITRENIVVLLQILVNDNLEDQPSHQMPLTRSMNAVDVLTPRLSVPHLYLREHVTAIVVYTALSGDKEKQLLNVAGAAHILVRVLQGCMYTTQSYPIVNHLNSQSISKTRIITHDAPVFLQATQEFAMMGLILLADKSIETMEKIVEAGGIALLVKMLAASGGRGKLGASWSEMAAAALMTLAGCNTAREEIVRVGGIASLVQVLKGEGDTPVFSLTGLAAMAQLLGVLAFNNEKTKLHMAEAGAVGCLVEILVGKNKCCPWPAMATEEDQESPHACEQDHQHSSTSSVLVALAQEAAGASLATVVLRCVGNAEAAVKAGAIGPLVHLLGPPISVPKSGLCTSGSPPELLPSTWKSSDNSRGVTNSTRLHGNAGNANVSQSLDDDEELDTPRAGRPLAAMAALGNLVSCFPSCWRQIVDAGGALRLANLRQGYQKADQDEIGRIDPRATTGNILVGRHFGASQGKVQESAALVLELLIECEEAETKVVDRPADESEKANQPSSQKAQGESGA